VSRRKCARKSVLLYAPGTEDARWGWGGGGEVDDEDKWVAAASSSVHPFKGKEWAVED
jgi:hypothetical protein